jgi:hypothetical protein
MLRKEERLAIDAQSGADWVRCKNGEAIGPMCGFGAGAEHAMPRTLFVSLALMCWALPVKAEVLAVSCDGTMKAQGQEEPHTITKMGLIVGHLEKLLSPVISDGTGVNVNESERERSGIICRQFCGVRRVGAIFRGALIILTLAL